jgi:uncharacterized protein YaiL (DUF2058 family)|tara:strand:- start:390 stop:557 length:168 start_codon:yes stop_codon:yes gene_type:complete
MQRDRQHHTYVLVPVSAAIKIEQRDTKIVVFQAPQNTVGKEDDPYANFQIPDDPT